MNKFNVNNLNCSNRLVAYLKDYMISPSTDETTDMSPFINLSKIVPNTWMGFNSKHTDTIELWDGNKRIILKEWGNILKLKGANIK